MPTLIERFKAASDISTPIVGITTADPTATILGIIEATSDSRAKIRWDRVRGMVGVNEAGAFAIGELLPPQVSDDPTAPAISPEMAARIATSDPESALGLALDLPRNAILFFINAHRFMDKPEVLQAIWNLRDKFKVDGRMLVMLAPHFTLPAELSHDVLILDEPRPSPEQLRVIIAQEFTNFELPAPNKATSDKGVDALRGLAAFPASQAVAMCLGRKTGLDINGLWERKRQMISQSPGCSVWRGLDRFADIGGVENVKYFLRAALNGKRAPRVIVFIDEIEKALGGVGSDSSGVSQEQHGGLLTYMQDTEATGIISVGPPGAAKSALAKAAGNEGGILTICFNLAAVKDKHVGESTVRLTEAFKVISAVSDNQALFIATCNSIGVLSTELRRRFTFGTFFFDLPTADERELIWSLYLKKFKLKGQRPEDEGWTGAEIRQCCDIADRLGISLVDASRFIVPIAKSAAAQIDKLRTQAHGNFISASKPGTYQYEKAPAFTVDAPTALRAVAR